MTWLAPGRLAALAQMKTKLSITLDVGILISLSCLFYLGLVGQLRWHTALFRFSLTRPADPVLICVVQIALKAVFNLNRGLFAMLSRRDIGAISAVASGIHRFETSLHTFYYSNRLNLGIALAALFCALALLEAYLRCFPHTLPSALANHVATGYNTGLSGIYRYDPEMKMNLMQPNYQRTMYFNGYRWQHNTDSAGFRNPADRAGAYVVLLGDSMIYGHGVEETSTVRHYLEAILERSVVNLGIQGNSIHQEYQVLKRFGLNLKPSYVFLFFLVNDIEDLTVFLSDEEMLSFLRLPVHDHSTPYFDVRPVRARKRLLDIGAYIDDLYVMKAYEFVKKQLQRYATKSAGASVSSWEALPPFVRDPRMSLAMRFHLRALQKIQDLAEQNRFRFTNVFIFTGFYEEEQVYEPIVRSFCKEHGIDFYSLRDSFDVARKEGVELFLKGDGHFSDAGASLVARLIAERIGK